MRRHAAWALTLVMPLCAAAPAAAQSGRDACLEAARAMVRQQARWDDSRERGRRDRDVLLWRAGDGTWGSCRLDARGMVYEVRVEAWGRGAGTGTWPGSSRPGSYPGSYPGVGSSDLTEEFGYDRRGDDYSSTVTRTLSGCQIACREDARCAAYTFSAREEKCWLKSRANAPQASRDMVTGIKVEGSTGGGIGGLSRLSEEWDFDRQGNDYDDFRVAGLSECKEACLAEGRCRAYTFDTRTRTCYLKDRVNTANRNEGMVTGYKQ